MMSRKSAGFDSKEEAWKYIKVHHRGSKLYLNRVDFLQRQSFTMKRYKHSIKHSKAGSGKGCHLASLQGYTHTHTQAPTHTGTHWGWFVGAKMDGNKPQELSQCGCILISVLPMGKLYPRPTNRCMWVENAYTKSPSPPHVAHHRSYVYACLYLIAKCIHGDWIGKLNLEIFYLCPVSRSWSSVMWVEHWAGL